MKVRTAILAATATALASACTYVVEGSSGEGADLTVSSTTCSIEQQGDQMVIVCADEGGTTQIDAGTKFFPRDSTGDDEPGEAPVEEGLPPLEFPLVQRCKTSTFGSAAWVTTPSSHFQINTLEGSVANNFSAAIVEHYEGAYAAVRQAIALEEEPMISVFLSPDRTTAHAQGKAWGRSFFDDRIEAIWTGSDKDFHRLHPGNLIAVTLLRHTIPAGRFGLPVLATGLAEYLDQSERGLHLAYTYHLISGSGSRALVAEFTDNDVVYGNAPLGGSLVGFLVERLGLPVVIDVFQDSSVTWGNNSFQYESVGVIDSASQLDLVLADSLNRLTGQSWAELKDAWRAVVLQTLSSPIPQVSSTDQSEIVNLVRVADLALNTDDADLYRSVLDGFYCVGMDEEARSEVSRNMVEVFEGVETTVLRIYPLQTRNFPTAWVAATRKQGEDVVSTTYYEVENFEAGWRITWAPEWP